MGKLDLEQRKYRKTYDKKILRKIYGAVNDRGIWRIRYNTEIYNLYKEPDVIKVVKANRLRWI
jgi:hypothetical protein